MLKLTLTVAVTACALFSSARASADFMDVATEVAPFGSGTARSSGAVTVPDSDARELFVEGNRFERGYYALNGAERVVRVSDADLSSGSVAGPGGWAQLAFVPARGGSVGLLVFAAVLLLVAGAFAWRQRGVRTR